MKGVRLVCNYTHHNFINLGKNQKKQSKIFLLSSKFKKVSLVGGTFKESRGKPNMRLNLSKEISTC